MCFIRTSADGANRIIRFLIRLFVNYCAEYNFCRKRIGHFCVQYVVGSRERSRSAPESELRSEPDVFLFIQRMTVTVGKFVVTGGNINVAGERYYLRVFF